LPLEDAKLPSDPELVELFKDLNARHFDDILPPVPVCRGIPEDAIERPDLNGLMRLVLLRRPGVPFGASATIYLASVLFETRWGSDGDRWQKVADTLLHEMVHLAVAVDALGAAHPPEYHHGEHFTRECNRISERAGWASVLPSSRAVDELEDAAAWPDNAIDMGLIG